MYTCRRVKLPTSPTPSSQGSWKAGGASTGHIHLKTSSSTDCGTRIIRILLTSPLSKSSHGPNVSTQYLITLLITDAQLRRHFVVNAASSSWLSGRKRSDPTSAFQTLVETSDLLSLHSALSSHGLERSGDYENQMSGLRERD
jgi:hypothetical protein